MAKLDFPSSPTPGQTYAAPNGVTYTWDDTVGTTGAWTAVLDNPANNPLTVTSPGSISGSPVVGDTLVYATGRASGGVLPYVYRWEWRLLSDGTPLQVGGNALTVPPSALDDQIYIDFTVTDSNSTTATGTTTAYPVGNTIVQGPFPGLTFSPPSPNASPASVNFGNLRGTATAIWPSNPSPATITVTGNMQFSINGGAYGTTGTIYGNDTINLIWDPDSIAAAANNITLTGSLTDGAYKNTFTITIDRSPSDFTGGFSDLTEQPTSTQITSNVFTPSGYNVPVPLSITGSSTPLTSIGASVNGGAFTSSNQTVTPGQTIQLRGTTGSANSTAYGITASLGAGPAVTDAWTATTVDIVPQVVQPSITAPTNGATDINPSAQIPAEVTITSSTYTPENGAGTHASSDWELYEGSSLVDSSIGDTTNLVSWTVAESVFTTDTNYSTRVRYTSTDSVNSPWSPFSTFTTAASFTLPPGTPTDGGYFGGQINDGGTIYNLIVAPREMNGLEGQYFNVTKFKDGTGGDGDLTRNSVYGRPATEALGDSMVYPGFYWCKRAGTGPNAGFWDTSNTDGTGIGGYNDWYIPATDELAVLYFFLKPTTAGNVTNSGSNPSSVAPYTPNTRYGPGFPNQTTSTIFREGGIESFFTDDLKYWSATQYPPDSDGALVQDFWNGDQYGMVKNYGQESTWRAIRRVPA